MKSEEVQGHQQIVRHRGSRLDLAHVELSGQGGEVDAAADVRPGHHGRHALQTGDVPVQQRVGQESARHSAGGADEENDHHPPGLFPDLLHVALQEQQRDAQRHREVPNDVVVEHTAGGNNGQVGRRQSDQQRDDGAGDLGRPNIFLLQPDGKGNGRHHQHQQRPGVVGGDEALPPQMRHKEISKHTDSSIFHHRYWHQYTLRRAFTQPRAKKGGTFRLFFSRLRRLFLPPKNSRPAAKFLPIFPLTFPPNSCKLFRVVKV